MHSGPLLGSPCPQSSPQQLLTQLNPRPRPNSSYNPPFFPLHSPQIPNLALRPALIPIPKMLTLPIACVKGSNL